MTGDITIRQASDGDAAGIVRAIRSGMQPHLLRAMIYGCSGIERYVADQISFAGQGADTVYTVAVDGDLVVGAVEMRLLPDALFLNYISNLPEYRSMGIGERMLRFAVDNSGHDTAESFLLDVLDDNTGARKWYDALGFQHDFTQIWSSIPLQQEDCAEPALISGYPQARACVKRFGFGQFCASSRNGAYTVGILGREWFRVTQPTALHDSALHAALRRIDASREMLAIARDDEWTSECPQATQIVARSHRLVSNLPVNWRV